VNWGYINHRRVAALIDPHILTQVDQQNLRQCLQRGLVDERGLLILPNSVRQGEGYLSQTIYDSFEFGDDHRVHKLYSDLVDAIAKTSQAIHITDESWTKSWVRQFVKPGRFIYLRRNHFFRDVEDLGDNVVRLAHTFKRGIAFEYLVETKSMFGVSSISVSFKKQGVCSSLAIVKSLEQKDRLVIRCTSVGLGVGTWPLDVYSARP
jgi:hypothetical protein